MIGLSFILIESCRIPLKVNFLIFVLFFKVPMQVNSTSLRSHETYGDEYGNEILNFSFTSREIVEVVRKLLSVFDTERVSSVVLRIESGLSVCQTNVVSE